MASDRSALSNLKYDFSAGIVVFLVALPLCLGIALASGADLFTGLISGVVGGIVVGLISNAQLAVSGPAAGLAVIVFNAIQNLGDYRLFLTAVVISAVFQIILGFLRAGVIASFFPSSVIKGMLAAIGIILVLKQIPHALGDDLEYFGSLDFLQWDKENTFTEVGKAIKQIKLSALLISTLSLSVLIVWPKIPPGKIKTLPAPLIVVVMGVLINYLLGKMGYGLSEEHLVQIPASDSFNQFLSNFTTPDWTGIFSYDVLMVSITLAIVSSIETLLSIEAIDKIDPLKRVTNTNLELKAQGVGNLVAGLIGGLPITAVIVRGSANITAGARSKMSTIIHGILLAISIVTISSWLNLIPYASLAAILLVVGYKLANVSLMKEMMRKGYLHFVPFFVTIVAINLSDLLIGIAIGLLTSIVFILVRNYKNPFVIRYEENAECRKKMVLKFASEVSFMSKSVIEGTLEKVKGDMDIELDASESFYIDDDVLEVIEDFKIRAVYKNIGVKTIGLKSSYKRQ